MILKIFTVYDTKVEAYLQPFYMQSKGAALRAFEDSTNKIEHHFNKHPEDYVLFEIGEFNDQTAMIMTHEAKVALGTAIEFLNIPNLKTQMDMDLS